ncbi:flagellar assembly protein FliH [Bacillus tianshenii]|nr:flagellar assembly protein FliH [Bacillus tianshenii]
MGVRSLENSSDANLPQNEEAQPESRDVQLEADQIIQQAHEEAQMIRQEAEQYSQEMLQQVEQERLNWETEKQQLIEQAKQEGYAAGYDQGTQDGYQQYAAIIEEARQVVGAAKLDYEKHLEDSEYTILHLGITAAEKILATKLEEDPDYYMHLVRRAIREVKEHENIQIQVHPTKYELLLTHKDELLALFTRPTSELYIYPNDEMQEFQCLIESSFGRIDASIDSQLNEIKLKLLQVLEEENGHESS